ncbi:hypothetical protein OPIT5_30250 [Opitutaceae bacterium TAV5]|nr:hypothetical protein OPIT5_30250 [Opitutaceae bacterium TAV5]
MDHHRHDFFEIFWFTEGQIRHHSDFEVYDVEPGTLVFIPAGQVHTWDFSEDVRGYIIAFDTRLFASRPALAGEHAGLPFLDPATSRPIIPVPPEDREGIDQACQSMLREYTRPGPYRDHGLRALLEFILIQCARHAENRTSGEEPEAAAKHLSREFSLLVEHHFSEKHRVKDYAALMQVSVSTLSRAVRQSTGRSPNDLISHRLLLEARRLLHYSTLTISEIAYQLGFNPPSNFGRFFKKHTKHPPGYTRGRHPA